MLTERFDRFFKSDTDKVKEAENILALLKDSPELQERARQRDDKRLARIRELLVEREEINRAQAEAMPRLRAAVTEAHEKEKQAHDALQAVTRERVNAEYERLGASGDFSLKLSKVEEEIKKAAPQEIDDFILEMIKADEKARLELNMEVWPGPKNRFTGEIKVRIIHSNQEAIEKKRAQIKAAIDEAAGMKMQAIPHDSVIARLDELRKGLPEFNRFETVERSLPDVSELRRGQ